MTVIKITGQLLFALIFFTSAHGRETGIATEQTLVLENNQVPQNLKKFNAARVYVLFYGTPFLDKYKGQFLRKDTITNLKRFTDSLGYGISGYRLIFGKGQNIDSVWQFDEDFKITTTAYQENEYLRIKTFGSKGQKVDNFLFDYKKKYKNTGMLDNQLASLMRLYNIYEYSDVENFTVADLWILSIGINDYGRQKYRNCQSDATSYAHFFAEHFSKTNQVQNATNNLNTRLLGASIFLSKEASQFGTIPDSSIHSFVLNGSDATRDSIFSVLKIIAKNAKPNDYFVFNFSGQSWMFTKDSLNYDTYFFPYEVIINKTSPFEIANRKVADKRVPLDNLISLKMLQEYISMIPCTNQLLITEAGPSENFKDEFLKIMIQNSPDLAALLNINRVIIVPNNIGYDNFKNTGKGPLNYFLTSLKENVFDLFKNEYKANRIVHLLKAMEYERPVINGEDYFTVFFETRFLEQYKKVGGTQSSKKRGIDLGSTDVKNIKGFSGNRHALIIGTDNYKTKDWDRLENPVYDATEMAEVLKAYYDYDVDLLKDPPMDTIYKHLSNYYKNLKEDDQFIIYIAGHGDFDEGLLDDGFIVCTDSKSPEIDPLRNTYIQHAKLKKMINKIPAKQVLVLLDICHGGVFDESVLGKQRDNPASAITNRNVLELLKDKSQLVTRKVLSSVGKESAFDGRAGKHSPFATYLLKILNARGGTEGIVTLSDIYALLQKASLNETETLKISPHIAGFGANDPMSEFILIPAKK
jgi:hypothetical protein